MPVKVKKSTKKSEMFLEAQSNLKHRLDLIFNGPRFRGHLSNLSEGLTQTEKASLLKSTLRSMGASK